jgi:hypothetical protein
MVGAAALHAGDFRAAVALRLPSHFMCETGIHAVFGYRRGPGFLSDKRNRPLIWSQAIIWEMSQKSPEGLFFRNFHIWTRVRISAGRQDRAEEKTAFVGEYSIWTSGQVLGAHVLLGFNNRGRADRICFPKLHRLISRCGRSMLETRVLLYICVQRVKVLVRFSGIARIWMRFVSNELSWLQPAGGENACQNGGDFR